MMLKTSNSLLGSAQQRKRPLRIGQHAENYCENHRSWRSDITLIVIRGYTETVWGVPCEDISVAWGAQGIRDLSVAKAMEDEQFLELVIGELEKTSVIERKDVISGTFVRVHSGYPACFDAYSRFGDLCT
jgi:hypothetical protein